MQQIKPNSTNYSAKDFEKLCQHLEYYHRACLAPSLRFAKTYFVLGKNKPLYIKSVNRYIEHQNAIITLFSTPRTFSFNPMDLIQFEYPLGFLFTAYRKPLYSL
jgi:hypothetical protein